MGQFGNQPDFATNDIKAISPSPDINTTTFLDASVIYIGDNATLGNELKVIPAGTVGPTGSGLPTAAQAVTFKGLGTGGFLPVTVDYVLTTPLSCGALIAAK